MVYKYHTNYAIQMMMGDAIFFLQKCAGVSHSSDKSVRSALEIFHSHFLGNTADRVPAGPTCGVILTHALSAR